MRIGLLCPYSLTMPGGVQSQALGLGRALRAQGMAARVLGPCDGPPPEPWVTPLGASIPTAGNGSMAAIAPDPAAALRTIRALRDEAFDVVHLHEPLVPGPVLTALLWSDAPLVGTFHRAGAFALSRLVRPLAYWVADHLSVRCAVSAEAELTARRALGGDYERVWNGIDQPAFAAAPPWARPPGAGVVLFVGRHEPRKGLAVLIEAVGRLDPGVTLWVAGEGPQTARLRQATSADGRVHWLGTIGEEEKMRRLRAADVVCAPSLHGESFGVVLIEAMAAGACVVASDLPGYRNVTGGERGALLVPPGDPAALAAAIGRGLSGGPDISALRDRGAGRAESFSMSRLAERYRQIYQDVLAAGSGPASPAGRHRLRREQPRRTRPGLGGSPGGRRGSR
ncbi:MAG: glycosyltransferase family 4 protein [Acidimicrobiales bacterium]